MTLGRRYCAWPRAAQMINLKTAKSLRLTIPPLVLLRADQVIQ